MQVANTQTPLLIDIEQVSDGWIKKYVLTYEISEEINPANEAAAGNAAVAANPAAAGNAAVAANPAAADNVTAADNTTATHTVPQQAQRTTLHTYEVASRKNKEAFKALLEANGAGVPPTSADALCIVAKTPRNSLVMIKEFRYPLNSWCIALPAGLIEPGEDLLTCATRELSEETGYAILPTTPARTLPQAGYSSTGMSDETVQIMFVQAEKSGQQHTEPNELIEVFELPIEDIPRFLEENTLPIGTRAQLILEVFAAQAR